MSNRIRKAAGAAALAAILTPASAFAASAGPSAAAPAPGGPPPSKAVLKLDHDTDLADAKVDDQQYAADVVKWVECMNQRGLPTTVTSTGVTAGGWTYGTPTTRRARFLESLEGENARDRVEDVCLVQAFGL